MSYPRISEAGECNDLNDENFNIARWVAHLNKAPKVFEDSRRGAEGTSVVVVESAAALLAKGQRQVAAVADGEGTGIRGPLRRRLLLLQGPRSRIWHPISLNHIPAAPLPGSRRSESKTRKAQRHSYLLRSSPCSFLKIAGIAPVVGIWLDFNVALDPLTWWFLRINQISYEESKNNIQHNIMRTIENESDSSGKGEMLSSGSHRPIKPQTQSRASKNPSLLYLILTNRIQPSRNPRRPEGTEDSGTWKQQDTGRVT